MTQSHIQQINRLTEEYMNEYAIYHRPESEYAYALDNRTLRIVLRVSENERLSSVELLYNNYFAGSGKRAAGAYGGTFIQQ